MATKKATKAAAKKTPAPAKTAAKAGTKIAAKKTASVSKPKSAAAPKAPATHHEIAAMAEQLWNERGRPEGSPHIDWRHAEQKLKG